MSVSVPDARQNPFRALDRLLTEATEQAHEALRRAEVGPGEVAGHGSPRVVWDPVQRCEELLVPALRAAPVAGYDFREVRPVVWRACECLFAICRWRPVADAEGGFDASAALLAERVGQAQEVRAELGRCADRLDGKVAAATRRPSSGPAAGSEPSENVCPLQGPDNAVAQLVALGDGTAAEIEELDRSDGFPIQWTPAWVARQEYEQAQRERLGRLAVAAKAAGASHAGVPYAHVNDRVEAVRTGIEGLLAWRPYHRKDLIGDPPGLPDEVLAAEGRLDELQRGLDHSRMELRSKLHRLRSALDGLRPVAMILTGQGVAPITPRVEGATAPTTTQPREQFLSELIPEALSERFRSRAERRARAADEQRRIAQGEQLAEQLRNCGPTNFAPDPDQAGQAFASWLEAAYRTATAMGVSDDWPRAWAEALAPYTGPGHAEDVRETVTALRRAAAGGLFDRVRAIAAEAHRHGMTAAIVGVVGKACWALADLSEERLDPPGDEADEADQGARGEGETSPSEGGSGRVKAGSAKRRMTKDEANRKAMELAEEMKTRFFALSCRRQAKQIGCAFGTWTQTDFYRHAEKKRAKLMASRPRRGGRQGPAAPRAFSLDEARDSHGTRDQIVHDLANREEERSQTIREQDDDYEPSPLEDDPPDGKPMKVRCRKRP